MASLPAEPEQEDEPRQSSAAQCISLNLLGEVFGPEFTHQCFQDEFIRGYQPTSFTGEQSKHSSYQHHDEATHELQVQVQLSPSCRQCQVSVNVRPKSQEIVERALKRPRLDDDIDKAPNGSASVEAVSSEAEPESTSKQNSEENLHPNETTNVDESTLEQMAIDEIITHCAKALPAVVTELPQDDYLASTVGTVVKEYQRNGIDFVVSLANGSDAAEYHEEVQKLAIWFIETADNVDLTSSEGGGYWKVLYIFQKHEDNKYSLVGYMTVFHFLLSPFKKPKSGTIARVCQVLILPPYQRMGHGKVLLKQLYDMAHDISNDLVEINVEDPAPACTCLRNGLDFELLKDSFDSETPWLDSSYYSITDVTDPDFFKPVSDADAVQAGATGCITPRQVQIAHEIYKLSLLPHDCSEDVQKKYRLMVKKRLVKVHREELGGCESKEAKQALLTKIFDETLDQYKSVLKRGTK